MTENSAVAEVAEIAGPRPVRAQPAPSVGRTGAIRREWISLLREHLPLLLIVTLYLASATIGRTVLGMDALVDRLGLPRRFAYLTAAWAILFVVVYAVRKTFVDRTTGGLMSGATWREFRERYVTVERLGGFALVLAAYSAWSAPFSAYKVAIPSINPFSWDERLMQFDRAFHFGVDPWRLLHPFVGNPVATKILDFSYAIWIPVTIAVVIWQAGSMRRALRMQFLLAFMTSWILLGTVGATFFSSVGPCFYNITGSWGPYEGLMSYLAATHERYFVGAVNMQQMVWERYTAGGGDFTVGISAMPSMHVAMATLMALVAWRTHRKLGIVFTIYAALIMIGSVHLGWHYAIDGYFSILAVLVIWWGTGRFVRWYGRRTGVPVLSPVAVHGSD